MKIAIAFIGVIFMVTSCISKSTNTSATDSSVKSVKPQARSYIMYTDIEPDIDPFIEVKGITEKDIRHLFEKMLVADQQYRDSLYNGNKNNEAFYSKKISVNDEANLIILDKIVQEFGWPEISVFGAKAAETSWLIVWHQRGRRHILCKYFDLMESAVARKEMNAASFNHIKVAVEQLSPDQIAY
ncbi:hypothetical protein [Dyadobacter pollutisoli]|uniref:Lipoprotein n=1 Tax=Dyadobacter pollutisoli TaxID=2910158 RepID=A0A9E8SNT6_9BACT|nr:hypothetical protein [Dyadobacter pollutisoli]WAC11117.1 hypothetical protein ON006_25700 [Dyadobacter pollutisoli]